MVKPLSEREYQALIASSDRIEGKVDSLTSTMQDFIVEQGAINAQCGCGIEENSQQNVYLAERQHDTEQIIIKNMPVIAFAAKLQSNMSKITIGFIITILGSYGINLSNEPAAPKPSNKEASQ